MLQEWTAWLSRRHATGGFSDEVLARKLALVLDALIEMLGPMRREAAQVWGQVMEQYGRVGVARGLAAGEVVEEIQQLRVLLIHHIGPMIAAMRPRRSVAVFLRLNAIVDRGIAAAVIGYTDTLVASLMPPAPEADPQVTASSEELESQLNHLESQLASIAASR